MEVKDRIEQAPNCEVINLTDAEKELYTGCGWKLARFVDGTLASLFDPMEVRSQDDVQAMADEAIENATAWLANAEACPEHDRRSEVWLVMCSCYQLCEPRRITLTDASGLARLARVIGEQMVEWNE